MTDLAVEPTVTTGPIAGSQKIYRDLEVSPDGPAAKVPFRRVNLSNGEHLDLYDTSGPYTDADAVIDVAAGLPPRPGVVRDRGQPRRGPGRPASARVRRCRPSRR